MPNEDYRPRFSFEISDEQQARVNKLLSFYGLKKNVFGVILDDFLDLIEEHGTIVIGLILDRHTKPREIMPSLKQSEMKSQEVKNGLRKSTDKTD